MLTQILSSVPSPRPATSHILNQPRMGAGSPAGDSGTTDRGTVGTAAPVESGREAWMRDRLVEAERTGEVIKLTGRRSVSMPGGDAA
ncbi:hypothetical protein LJR042_003509 [Microbacterium maritypicum]|uniref:hypothetical protein n=1 Tax=Microbacterium maritypicum TaxID=33918 RepID=UPI003ED0969A